MKNSKMKGIDSKQKAIPSPKRISRIRLERNVVFIGAAGFEDRAAAGLKLLQGRVEGNIVAITVPVEDWPRR